jgi:hypothetical protein
MKKQFELKTRDKKLLSEYYTSINTLKLKTLSEKDKDKICMGKVKQK